MNDFFRIALIFNLTASLAVNAMGTESADSTVICTDATPPVVSSEKSVSCSGQPVVLQASGCDGTVVWSNKKTGLSLLVYPTKTSTYSAYCQKTTCKSSNSKPYTVEINIPRTPIINASSKKICYGQSATLTVVGCLGQVIWSDGSLGTELTVRPQNTTKYTVTCRVDGCVSCFAEDVVVTVLGAPLAINASQQVVCAGESVMLSAAGSCAGQIKWSDGTTAQQLTVQPTATTVYAVSCVSEGCATVQNAITVQIALPTPPTLVALRSSVCKGEKVGLSASNCTGTVKWSNGLTGNMISVQPEATTTYTASCERGVCRSTESSPVAITVTGEAPAKPTVLAQMSNRCPFTTVDLSSALQVKPAGITFDARTESLASAALVENVGAVTAEGTYYIFAKNAAGCQSEPAAVRVLIVPCREPTVPVCMTNPAQVSIEKAEKTTVGNYFLTGKWGGSATSATWSSNGTGTFNSTNLANVVYIPSATDRAAGTVTIALTTNDPDGTGPCAATLATVVLDVKVPTRPKEIVGLSKAVQSWKRLSNNKFEIEYRLQVSNLGSNDLIEVQLIDSLDKTFKNGAVIVGKPLVKVFDSAGTTTTEGWATDTTFTGKGADNNLTVAEITGLKAGQSRVVLMTVQIDVANAQDSIFYNTAYVAALDIDGNLCRDVSSDGLVADLDGDGDPANDSTPTAITLQSFRKDTDLFVPEGFSPNGDGINDVLVIQKVPALRVSIEIYNRWGGLVYRNDDYKNDWNGTVANKTNSSIPVGTYFSVIKTSDGRELSKFLTVNR